jgi:ACS family tartrate transporter-like MFS transporter
MNAELGISPRQFGPIVAMFFPGYFLFEIPSNLVLHKVGAGIWISRVLISWGIVAVLMGFAQNVYRQREQARVISLFLMGLPITSIVGAPVSDFILDHVHWLGIPAILAGVVTYVILPARRRPVSVGEREGTDPRDSSGRRDSEKGRRKARYLDDICGPPGLALGPDSPDPRDGAIRHHFLDAQAPKALFTGTSNSWIGVQITIPHLPGWAR